MRWNMLRSITKSAALRTTLHRPWSAMRFYHDAKRILDNPNATRVSWLKNVVEDVLPLTTDTIPHVNGMDMAMAVTYCPSLEAKFDPESKTLRRRVDDSYLEIILPFSEHEKLREGMAKPDGHSIRYGKLFEILDALAADVGYRHAGGTQEGLTIVTASVDELKMFADISLNNDLRLQAYLSYVGRSSMEVGFPTMHRRSCRIIGRFIGGHFLCMRSFVGDH